MLGLDLKDRNFYNKMITIAAPIMLQNLISSAVNMIDTAMVGALGEAQIAAVGLANQVFFVFFLLIYGINSGCGIFIAQYWGAKDEDNVRKTVSFSVMTGAIVGLLFTLVAIYFPKNIMQLFTSDTKVIEHGIIYMKYVSLSYVLTSISIAYSYAARNIGDVNAPTVISIISLITNGVLNFILIFGYLGFPRLEVQGAAIATVAARLFETLALVYWVYKLRSDRVLSFSLRDILRLKTTYIKNILVTAFPVILNDVFWALGMTMYSAAYARIGTTALASIQIASTVQNIFIVISIGLASACAVMLGNEIGADNKANAILYGKRFLRISLFVGLVLGIVLIIISPLVLMLFGSAPGVSKLARTILLIMGIFLWVRFMNNVLIVGILRSGGDTTFSMIMETCSVWIVGVPLAFAGALWWHLPVYIVYTLISLEELVKIYLGMLRVRSGRWVKDVR
jgi:putative MATE family efflux protein